MKISTFVFIIVFLFLFSSAIIIYAHNNNVDVLEETYPMSKSKSKDLWLNSGAYFYNKDGIGSTVHSEIPEDSRWRIAYFISNPNDTDNGFHPQNIFRLVTRNKFDDFEQSAYFKIDEYHLSSSNHRTASNGLLFFIHYKDGDNLYYAGIRVDGYAVIKKKQDGIYYTISSKQIFDGDYDRLANPNLIPEKQWVGVKAETQTNADGSVLIKLFVDDDHSGKWDMVLAVRDDGTRYGHSPISGSGYAGIRTDFMDVEFDDFKITKI
ncbi:MAG: hypothetical protein AABX19_02645 [Nanoarchaeota archaeon]